MHCVAPSEAFSRSLAFVPLSELRTSRLGYWKIPLMGDGDDITGAHISEKVEMENSQDPRANGVARFGNMNMNYSRPNESIQDVEISIPRAVRVVVRTIHVGLSATAKASTLWTDTSTTKSKESSFQIAAFVINHPILAMLVVGLIALIGFVCIFALPIGWLPF
jgi:hypothetical protein